MRAIRICIKDLMALLNYSDRAARDYMARLREFCGKEPGEIITVFDLCHFMGIDITEFTKFQYLPKK